MLWESFCSLLVTGVETDRRYECAAALAMLDEDRQALRFATESGSG
jgi:hypothetical protein